MTSSGVTLHALPKAVVTTEHDRGALVGRYIIEIENERPARQGDRLGDDRGETAADIVSQRRDLHGFFSSSSSEQRSCWVTGLVVTRS